MMYGHQVQTIIRPIPMKKVLLFIDSLNSGGAQRQLVGLAKLLKDKGFRVKVIVYHNYPFYKPFLEGNGVDNEVIKGANIIYKRIWKIGKAIKNFGPDIVISYLDIPNMISCYLKAINVIKCPLIVSERNTTQELSSREKLKFYFYKWADRIVPNSYSQTHFIAENYPNLQHKTITITNFVDTEFFSPYSRKNEGIRNIICVGRISEQKNVKRFLNVVEKLKKVRKDFHIRWYGNSLGTYASECFMIVNSKGLNDVFEFCSPDSNIRDRYRESDIFCLPSLYEGFPNVLCEAMSCGLPVLCSSVCDNPDIVEDNINGFLFDPTNEDNIINAFIRMLELEERQLKLLGIQSREISIEKFSSDSFVNKYVTMIETL